ncbi:MAG: response regulator [Elusimicrobiota bacterium]
MDNQPKILIVDDDESIRNTMAGILKKEGYQVDLKENGQSAIEAAKEESYDIALLDIKMPGINGVETFKKIKDISPETIVMMMTAYAVDDLMNEAVQQGAKAVLNKPLDMRRVLGMIEKMGKKNLVLIVDDEMGIRESLALNLETEGYKVVGVSGGDKAVEIAKRRPADIILLDVLMPGMDGVETLKKIKEKYKEGEEPTVVMMSGYDVDEKVEEAYTLGVKKFFKKPVNIEELKKELAKLLKEKGVKGRGKESPSVLIVDDETLTRDMLNSVLSEAGYEVKTASDGEEALKEMTGDNYNVILLDVKLPDTNGFDLCEKIKKMEPDVGVVMMTAYERDEKIKETANKGGYNIVFKPFDMDKLLNIIRNISGKKEKSSRE